MKRLSYLSLITLTTLFACAPEPETTEQDTEATTQTTEEIKPETDKLLDEQAVVSIVTTDNPDNILSDMKSNELEGAKTNYFLGTDNKNEIMSISVGEIPEDHPTDMRLNLYEFKDATAEQSFRVSIRIKVKDFKTWKWLYDSEEKSRQNAGMDLLVMGTVAEDPSLVFILIALPDIATAKEMMNKPVVKTRMEQSGVIGEPDIRFWRLP